MGFFVAVIILTTVLVIQSIGTFVVGVGDFFFDEEENEKGEFTGAFWYNGSVNLADEFSITIPSGLKTGFMYDDNVYDYEYDLEEDCEFSFLQPNGYTSGKTLINQMAIYYSDDETINVSSLIINNTTWYWFSSEHSFGITIIMERQKMIL